MAINFSGEFTTPRSPEEVFDFLSDPNQFGPLLPDFQSMTMTDPTHFAVKVRVGVGNIRGTAEIKMELTEAVKPVRALYKGQGTAVGSQVTVSAGFDLSPLPDSTKVGWQGEANVFGKLASMAGGMLEPLGRKNIQKLIDGLQKALAEPIARPGASAPVEAAGFSPTDPNPRETGASAPAEVAGVSPSNLNPQAGESSTPVEAAGFSPANPNSRETGVPAPADSNVQGNHGDDSAQPNN